MKIIASIAQTLADLMQLNVGSSKTPIYTLGLGDDVDHNALNQLTRATGGRHVPLDDPGDIDDALAMLSEYGPSSHRVCVELPDHACGSLHVRINHRFDDGENVSEGSVMQRLELPCHGRARGRVATLLLTLEASDMASDMASDTVRRLITQTVNWASPVDAPRVLFVRDDFHHDEFAHDTGNSTRRWQPRVTSPR